MKRRELIMSGLGFGLAGAAGLALAADDKETTGTTATRMVDASPETVAKIKAVLQEHDKAFTAHDLDGVLSTYQKGPQAVLMGTGPGELWSGPEEIGDAYQHFFADFDKGSQEFKYNYVNATARGEVAWMTVAGDITFSKGGAKTTFPINISGVLVDDGGKWQFSQMHFSNLTGPEKPADQNA